MDPRHPEQAITRMRELMEQYDRIEKDMGKATTSAQLGQLEREGGLVVQEICLVAPRIHEAMMQASRQRRHDISRGLVEKPVEKLKDDTEFKKVIDDSIEVVEKAKDIVEKALKDTKKKTSKKKAEKYTKATIGMKQTSASGGLDEKGEAEWKTTEEKPKKKTTRKKKTAKKKEDE